MNLLLIKLNFLKSKAHLHLNNTMVFPSISLESQYRLVSHNLFCSNKPVSKVSPTAVGERTVEWENIMSSSAWYALLWPGAELKLFSGALEHAF